VADTSETLHFSRAMDVSGFGFESGQIRFIVHEAGSSEWCGWAEIEITTSAIAKLSLVLAYHLS